METSITNNKEKVLPSSNPNLDNNWLKNLSDTLFVFGIEKKANACKGKDLYTFYKSNTEPIPPIADNECFTVYTLIDNAEQLEKQYNDAFKKAFPLTPDECFKKE